jgi:hypothetical protein
VLKNSILTKDNLLKRGWTGNDQCQFCSEKETVNHLLFGCGLAKLAWQVVLCAFHLNRPPDRVEDLFGGLDKILSSEQEKSSALWCWGTLLDTLENQK